MKISIGADHGGFELKTELVKFIESLGHDALQTTEQIHPIPLIILTMQKLWRMTSLKNGLTSEFSSAEAVSAYQLRQTDLKGSERHLSQERSMRHFQGSITTPTSSSSAEDS
jgi:hypothetical protein